MSAGLRKLISKRVKPTFYLEEVTPERILVTKKEVSRILGNVAERVPEEFSLQKSYNAILAYYKFHKHLGGLSRKYVRHIPYIIFDNLKGIGGDQRLEEMRGFLDAYFSRLRGNAAQSLIHSLLYRLIVDYPDYEKFKKLYVLAEYMVTGECDSHRCEQFRDVHTKYQLFKPEGVGMVWEAFCNAQGGIEERLQELEMPNGLDLEQSRFFDAVVEHGIDNLKSILTKRTASAEQQIAVLNIIGFGDGGRYGGLRLKLISALLLPFIHTAPEESIKNKIKHFLLSTYGDPRITGGKYWHGVDPQAYRVILSWLVEDVLEDFFRLFSYVAERDEKVMNHWKYRERFWRAYLEKGYITEAWVAFSNKMDQAALEQMSLSAENYGRFAHQAGLQPNHAALIMRIDNLIVTDWNHNGQYSVWVDGQSKGNVVAPEPYQKVYFQKSQLHQGAVVKGSHVSSANGLWQKNLSEAIELFSRSGVTINKSYYTLAKSKKNYGG